jgi:hypothetical protein
MVRCKHCQVGGSQPRIFVTRIPVWCCQFDFLAAASRHLQPAHPSTWTTSTTPLPRAPGTRVREHTYTHTHTHTHTNTHVNTHDQAWRFAGSCLSRAVLWSRWTWSRGYWGAGSSCSTGTEAGAPSQTPSSAAWPPACGEPAAGAAAWPPQAAVEQRRPHSKTVGLWLLRRRGLEMSREAAAGLGVSETLKP